MRRPRVLLYLEQMLRAARLVVQYAADVEEDEFLEDTMMQQAMAMNLQIIGEQVTQLQKKHPAFLLSYPEIEWYRMTGMRNRIAHGYFDLNVTVVWQTIRNDVPGLLEQLPKMIDDASQDYSAGKPTPTPDA